MEPATNILYLSHHRSRKRIRDFGEVFTPEKHVQQMLDMLDPSIWANTDIMFFEPTCGQGNFVSALVERRLIAFIREAKKHNIKKPHFYAVANTLNNLWAIDIDSKNIEMCRKRVRTLVFNFLKKHEEPFSTPDVFIRQHRDFLVHVLCCIEWQIQVNESLSCLEQDGLKAKKSASKTIVSKKWLNKNQHRPIIFCTPWGKYFKCMKQDNIIPKEYTKNYKILANSSPNKNIETDKKNTFKKSSSSFKGLHFIQEAA